MSTEDIQNNIVEYGWHCVSVFDPEGKKNDFTYSIGFERSFEHPEILIFGLEREIAHSILTDIANDLKNGVKYESNIKISNVIGGEIQVIFVPIRKHALSEYLGTAVDFYQEPFRAWVMLWPDKENIFPTEEGCRLTVQNEAIEII